ncbi:MAG: heme-dependent oxidative N-demethylase subunit alpha family protein, partial [Pseudomonadota bacterium]
MQFQPFTAPAKPFIIGLAPLDPARFLLLDEDRHAFQAQKQALYEQCYDDVCRAREDTMEGQKAAAHLLTDCLTSQYGDLYSVSRDAITDKESGEVYPLPATGDAPLADVALLVQDDLLLMRRAEDGWRLVAASLCFPSSWNLHEKFDKPLEAI